MSTSDGRLSMEGLSGKGNEIFSSTVVSAGATVTFRGPQSLQETLKDKVDFCYIPDICFCKEHLSEVIVDFENGETTSLNFQDKSLKVIAPWSKMNEGLSLLYVAYPLMEMQHQEAFRLTAHSAGVRLTGERTVLLLGKEGSGKTSTALELCLRHGASLVGNDICVLGFVDAIATMYGGTKFISLRRESVMRNHPGLLTLYDRTSSIDPWLDKITVSSASLGIECTTGYSEITEAYLIHIDNSMDRLIISPVPDQVTRLYLNENFSRYIRSSCNAFLGGGTNEFLGFIPSFDKLAFFQWRCRFIEFLLRDLHLLHISGSLEKVACYINHKEPL